MKDIKSFALEELKEEIRALGEKEFRAAQLYDWMHKKLAGSYEEMTNLPKAFRERLRQEYSFTTLHMVREQVSGQDDTRKYLFQLADGNLIETVLMKYHHGNSVCISSQVGCRMGCRFCASTLDGLERSLTAAEMLEQVYEVTRRIGERVSNVVVMGMGEPLDNYDNLLKFLRLISDGDGLNISQRNLTVSTCGLVPKMRLLADEKLQITLALSLHAVTDERRREIMPVANCYSIAELMEACAYYFEQTGRRITFEYSLINGVNDSEEEASALAGLAAPLHAHVNLIPVNPVKERNYQASGRASVENFKNRLEKRQINVTIRREMGRDIDGACGQLRRKKLKEEHIVL